MAMTVEIAGLHPATVCCIEALQWLHGQRQCANILEIGCGSGVLSVVAAGLWQAGVLAADIAPQAVADTQQLSREQGMAGRITAIRSDGFKEPLIRKRAPYDLIICNLLAEPIAQWAPEMQSHLTKDGVCLLSGILAWLAPTLEDTYKSLGFEIIHTISRSPWMTYVMRNQSLSA
jgi:ribosomal protein L11 methyltransferase